MTTTNVKRFIALQTQINAQIALMGEADAQLAGELELVGDQLTGDEINQLYIHYEGDEMEYEDVEEQIS
jgi:hypothetical protein